MAEPRITVAPPARKPRIGGLLNVAEFRDNVPFLAASANVQYVAEPCNLAYDEAGFCYNEAVVTDKAFDEIASSVGVVPNWGLYAGVGCWISNDMDFDRRAQETLAASELRGVEYKLGTWLDAHPGKPTLTSWVEGIAHADGDADDNYIGQPIILLNRADAVRAKAEDAIDGDRDGNLWTPNGTPVVASAGFTEGFVYVTGGITLLRSAVITSRSEALADNLAQAIAERAYGIIVDCDYRAVYEITPVP